MLAPGSLQQRLWRGTLFRIAARLDHAPIIVVAAASA
jgi:hypothetical protein